MKNILIYILKKRVQLKINLLIHNPLFGIFNQQLNNKLFSNMII